MPRKARKTNDVNPLRSCEGVVQPDNAEIYNHYFKTSPTTKVDVYRVLKLFNVTDPAVAHAVKKLLVMGGRGAKNTHQDLQEAIDSLRRAQQMLREENATNVVTDCL